MEVFMYDLIIVGAGPAGLTAALYALRANKKVLVLEEKCYGGQIINANKIENYPAINDITGVDFANNLYEQAKNLGMVLKYEEVIAIEEDRVVVTNKNKYQAKAIVLATGTEKRKLGLAKEDEYLGKGISYCATCDGHFYKKKIVAVVGGGNTALEDALYLSKIVERVYLIHRRSEFRGEEKYYDLLRETSNVTFILNAEVIKLNGNDQLESIDIRDRDGNISNIAISCLFVAIGQKPANDKFANLIELDEDGYIKTYDDVHTNKKGIYVAGDARVKEVRQLTTAVADGTIAATIAIREMR